MRSKAIAPSASVAKPTPNTFISTSSGSVKLSARTGEHDFGDEIAVFLGDDFFNQVDIEFDLANNAVRLYETKDCEAVSLAYWTTEPAGVVPIEAGSKIW